jgi:hypothetical protein
MALTTPRVCIDDRPRHLGRAAAALFATAFAVVVIGTVIWRDDLPGAAVRDLAPAPALTMNTPSDQPAGPSMAALAVPMEALAQATPTRCPYQRLDLAFSDGKPALAACVGVTRVVVHGGLRSHLVEPNGTSVWSLQVDVSGGEVMSVKASAPGHSSFHCEQAACAGVSIGPRDAHGQRRLALKDTVLTTAAPAADDASPSPAQAVSSLRLSTTLAMPADRDDAQVACGDSARIDVVEQQGANFALCPTSFSAGGADEGRRAFEFIGTEGDQLVVELTADGTIDSVRLGALHCLREACSGVATQALGGLDADVGRRFSFFGLTLKDAQRGGSSATLTGSVVVPPL